MKYFAILSALVVPALLAACSASKDSTFDGGGTTSSAGVGGNSLDVSVGVGSGGGTQGGCDAAVAICDDELKDPKLCDEGLNLGDPDAMNAAKAIDLCKASSKGSWGVLSAKYVRADGSAAAAGPNTGLVPKFGSGASPQAGKSMLALSSGHARDVAMPEACASQTCENAGPGKAPTGFPQDVPNCPGSKDINDDIGLELKLKAPVNAKGYQFNFAFMSFEFAEYVCTEFNDQFIALVSPPPMGSVSGNISFDKKKNPVSVNLALFDHCDPATKAQFGLFCSLFGAGNCPPPPNPYCPQGPSFMQGTGFGGEWGDAGSTGWLVTTAPVEGGSEFTIRFAIWDTGDTALDSTVLVDNFRWSADPVGIDTETVPDPK